MRPGNTRELFIPLLTMSQFYFRKVVWVNYEEESLCLKCCDDEAEERTSREEG